MTIRWSVRNIPVIFIAVFCLLVSCGKGGADGDSLPAGDTLTTASSLLTLVDHGDGMVSATIINPWDTTQVLSRYLLVDTVITHGNIPHVDGYTTVTVPVKSAIVYSSVHTSAFEDLGSIDVVKGVADASYFMSPEITGRIADGRIADIGNSMSPSLEKIIELSPEIAIVSPYKNSGQGVLDKTGITVVNMADYMESEPLARAEWLLLAGALVGKTDKAREMYAATVGKYNEYKALVADAGNKPLVLCELPYSGVWYQPGGASYMATLIRDAGGRPLLEDDTSAGSVQLDMANVYNIGGNADVWLIKNDRPLSLSDIASVSPLIPKIKAFAAGKVYTANTSKVTLYDDLAFHPDRVLRDYMLVLYPDSATETATRYFQKAR